jgi:hypothetical protein
MLSFYQRQYGITVTSNGNKKLTAVITSLKLKWLPAAFVRASRNAWLKKIHDVLKGLSFSSYE